MSNYNKNQTTQKPKSTMPQYNVAVGTQKTPEGKTFWTSIGSGWDMENGGISVKLNAHPIGDSIAIFPKKDKE